MKNVPTTRPAASHNRTPGGQFGVGNGGGPGAPLGALVSRLRAALVQSVTPDDIADIGRQLLTQAKQGDLQALKLLLQYTVGGTHQAVAVDRSAVEELEVYNRLQVVTRVAEMTGWRPE